MASKYLLYRLYSNSFKPTPEFGVYPCGYLRDHTHPKCWPLVRKNEVLLIHVDCCCWCVSKLNSFLNSIHVDGRGIKMDFFQNNWSSMIFFILSSHSLLKAYFPRRFPPFSFITHVFVIGKLKSGQKEWFWGEVTQHIGVVVARVRTFTVYLLRYFLDDSR